MADHKFLQIPLALIAGTANDILTLYPKFSYKNVDMDKKKYEISPSPWLNPENKMEGNVEKGFALTKAKVNQ